MEPWDDNIGSEFRDASLVCAVVQAELFNDRMFKACGMHAQPTALSKTWRQDFTYAFTELNMDSACFQHTCDVREAFSA